jgi:hypothetical protein
MGSLRVAARQQSDSGSFLCISWAAKWGMAESFVTSVAAMLRLNFFSFLQFYRSVDREDRIAISHAGDVDLVVFEADINALLAE